jgi:hypothetical protein
MNKSTWFGTQKHHFRNYDTKWLYFSKKKKDFGSYIPKWFYFSKKIDFEI